MTTNAAAQFYDQVERVHHDWLYDNPKVLHGLIRSLKPSVVVEVGVYKGYGSSWMAQALKENGKGHLYGIDNFSLRDHEARLGCDAKTHLMNNLGVLGLAEYFTLIVGDSDKVEWPERVDFAYIDGWHSYLAAKHDFEKCAKLGAKCVCFDDTIQAVGPRLLVQEIRMSGEWDVVDVLNDCGMSICMKRIPKGPITFSQELPNNPGVDLQTLDAIEQLEHFTNARHATGVDYGPIAHLICEGRKQ